MTTADELRALRDGIGPEFGARRRAGRTAIAVLVAAAGAAVTLTTKDFGLYGLLPAAVIVATVFVLRARVAVLWPAVLLVFALIPLEYLELGQVLDKLSPVLLLALLVVLLRGTGAPAWLHGPRNVAWVLVAYLAIVGVAQPVLNPAATLLGAAGLAIALILVPMHASWRSGFVPVVRTFAALGAVLGAWAVAESVTRWNPLAAFYAAGPFPLVQDWDVYRVETTLGNPLLNSAFFSLVAVVDLAMFVRTAKRGYLLLLVPALVGDVLTFSRTGLLAFAAGAVGTVLLTLLRRTTTSGTGGRAARAWLIVAFVVAAAGALAVTGALGRYSSDEATSSAAVRADSFGVIPSILARTHFLGAGAGSSGQLFSLYGGAAGEFPLENSALQVLLSFGIPGVLLLVAASGWFIVRAIRRGALVGPAMLLAYVVAATGFNLFEAYPSALLLPALGLALTVMEVRAGDGDDTQTAGATSVRVRAVP